MELLRFDRLEDLDFPKLMEIYREGNIQTIPYFFPDETDPERGLRGWRRNSTSITRRIFTPRREDAATCWRTETSGSAPCG